MPAIYLFNRRTFFGGDDLQPAVFLAHLLRLVQLTVFLGPIVAYLAQESRLQGGVFSYILFDSNQFDDSCRHSHMFGVLLMSYAVGSACYAVGSAVLEWRISHWAGIGAPTEPQPRSIKVSYLLELKLIPFSIVLFLVFSTGLTTIAYAPYYYRCSEGTEEQEPPKHFRDRISLWWITALMLAITQLSEIFVSWIYLLHLCSQPPRTNYFLAGEAAPDFEQQDYALGRHELIEEMWAERCASACQCLGVASCFMFGGREVLGQGQFGDVARALADYLEARGVLDVVPSDIAAGFLVLQRLQKLRLHRSRKQIVRTLTHQSNSIRPPHDPTLSTATADEEDLISFEAPTPPGQTGSSNRMLAVDDSLAPLDPRSHDGLGIGADEGLLVPLGGESVGEEPRRLSSDPTSSTSSGQRESRTIFSRDSLIDMSTLEEGARYAKYALAIYTWVLYLYVHPATGVPRLAAKGCLACCCRKKKRSPLVENLSGVLDENGRFEEDNICESHKTALLLTAGLNETDLVYLQLKSGFRHNPYCILLDHEWKCVVVSIRGTFSLEDCVTDVLIEPERLDEMGREYGFDAEHQYCHGGVLLWVRNIYRDLQNHQILEKLLLEDNALYPNYSLRLVGHSLGAAACTILSYMLRPRFPSLRCVNYSPPGYIVPRLSFDAMTAWRDEILDVIGRIKVPKAEVIKRLLRTSYRKGNTCEVCFDPPLDDMEDSLQDIKDILYDPGDVPDTEYQRQLSRFKVIHEERRRARGELREIKLFPPGKMIHLVKTGERRQCVHGIVKCLTCFTTNYGFEYTPVWINNDGLGEIVVNPHMGTDHFPNRMLNVVSDIAVKYGLNVK
ncbi:hypothetical protein ACA910_019654 [Epithemia clementina (nom. ined.)]